MKQVDFPLEIEIQYTATPRALENISARGVLWQASDNEFLINIPDTAGFFVTKNSISIEKVGDSDQQKVLRHLWSTPLAAYMLLNKKSVFHASVAAAPNHDSAVIIAGDSGAGKSTLLAGLLQQGWKMLADELAIVGLNEAGIPLVYPSHPEILLWDNSRKEINTSNLLEHASLANGKKVFSAENLFINAALPIKSIFLLSVHNKADIEVKSIQGQNIFNALNHALFNTHIADALIDRMAHFQIITKLSKSIKVQRIFRPRGKWMLAELLGLIQ